MKFTLDGAQTIVSLNLEEAREMAKYDHRTSEYWPTLIGERLWFLNMLNNIEAKPIKHGKWVYVKTIINGEKEYKCSECNAPLYCYGTPKQAHYDWCYSCGARMDEVENGR